MNKDKDKKYDRYITLNDRQYVDSDYVEDMIDMLMSKIPDPLILPDYLNKPKKQENDLAETKRNNISYLNPSCNKK